MKKKDKKLITSIVLLLVALVASAIFAAYQAQKIASLEAKASFEPIKIGHIDFEKGLIYVGCNDLVYTSQNGEEPYAIVWDILPECLPSSLPDYFENFYEESFGIGLTYQAVSRSGRFLVESSNGNTYWVEPSVREYITADDGTVVPSAVQAFTSLLAKSEDVSTESE